MEIGVYAMSLERQRARSRELVSLGAPNAE
jgi:hypothetical protein